MSPGRTIKDLLARMGGFHHPSGPNKFLYCPRSLVRRKKVVLYSPIARWSVMLSKNEWNCSKRFGSQVTCIFHTHEIHDPMWWNCYLSKYFDLGYPKTHLYHILQAMKINLIDLSALYHSITKRRAICVQFPSQHLHRLGEILEKGWRWYHLNW